MGFHMVSLLYLVLFFHLSDLLFSFSVLLSVCVCQYTSDFESVNSAQNSAEKKIFDILVVPSQRHGWR